MSTQRDCDIHMDSHMHPHTDILPGDMQGQMCEHTHSYTHTHIHAHPHGQSEAEDRKAQC